MPTQNENITAIIKMAENNPDIEVLWLYGSRARNKAAENSDYDLAVAFKSYLKDPIESRLRPELLSLEWRRLLDIDLSIVDINQASIQLAYTIVQDNSLLQSKNDFRWLTEEQIIMSKWELDHLYHRKHYA